MTTILGRAAMSVAIGAAVLVSTATPSSAQQAGWSETKDFGEVTEVFTGWQPWSGTTYHVKTHYVDRSQDTRRTTRVPKAVYDGCQVGDRMERTKQFRTYRRRTFTKTTYQCW